MNALCKFDTFRVGDLVQAYSCCRDGFQEKTTIYYARAFEWGGMPGNMNSSIRRYHGWRGSSNNMSIYAEGVRRVLEILPSSRKHDFLPRVRLGAPLKAYADPA